MESATTAPVEPKRRGRKRGTRNLFPATVFFDDEDPTTIIEPQPPKYEQDATNLQDAEKYVNDIIRAVQLHTQARKEAHEQAWNEILKQRDEEAKEKRRQVDAEELGNSADKKSLSELIAAGQSIPTVRKLNFDTDGLTDEEQAIIRARVRIQQLQFAEYERKENQKKVEMIWEVHPHVTEEEALKALEECSYDEDEVIANLTDYNYLRELRLRIAQSKTPKPQVVEAKSNESNAETETTTKKKKRGRPRKASDASESSEVSPHASDEVDDEYSSDHVIDDDEESSSSKVEFEMDVNGTIYRTRRHKKQKRMTVPKLKLDDAVAQVTTEHSMEGWSQARIRAWQLRHINPNAYYYRFNAPGEVQRNGKWTEEEKRLFFKRMAEFGVNGNWGLFSTAIPGRVGYQCANFYRQLIEAGEIQDDRYKIDEKGKAHFMFKAGTSKKAQRAKRKREEEQAKKSAASTESVDSDEAPKPKRVKVSKDSAPVIKRAKPKVIVRVNEAGEAIMETPGLDDIIKPQTTTSTSTQPAASNPPTVVTSTLASAPSQPTANTNSQTNDEKQPVRKRRGRRRKKGDDDEDDEYRPSSKTAELMEKELEVKQQELAKSNPLPGFIDSITSEQVVQPAISPYGHVLSYSTWIKCLQREPKNTCPFTKKPLKKRDLVLLTWDNIDQYRDKIIYAT